MENVKSDSVVFPASTETPQALNLLDEYLRNADVAIQKLTEALTKSRVQVRNIEDSLLVVNGQKELALNMKQKMTTIATEPVATTQPSA